MLREKLQSVERIATTALASQPHGDKECGEHICKAIAEIRKEIGCESCGNASAMREALVKCREIALQWQADEADGVAGTTEKPNARSAAEAVIDMEFEINAALSVPARNCDRFTYEVDARSAFLNEMLLIPAKSEYVRWLFALATDRKGEGDGR